MAAKAGSVTTLKAFYELMHQTAVVRRRMVEALLEDRPAAPEQVESLRMAREALATISRVGEKHRLSLDSESFIDVDLSYEAGELDKDILYAEKGEIALLAYLRGLHADFDRQVSETVDLLLGIRFNAFITDRDGTINNYCGRYESSIQSAYNAVFVSRFARSQTSHPIILTSAPLKNLGLVDVNVGPSGVFIQAASKGREFIDMEGLWHSFPIEDEKKALMDDLEARLREIIGKPDYHKFALIGSGFQVKFGQITLARQDISNSIGAEESKSLLAKVSELLGELDPRGESLRIEDTGLDIEIILTVASDDGGAMKDFDKGDGVRYVSQALGLKMSRGPHLVCGDTSSDVPMLQAAMDASPGDTYAVFVTRKEALAARVRESCPKSVIVDEPDVLVTALGRLGS